MEHTEAVVQTTISLHQVLNALDQLSYDYPCERLAPAQIERIEGAARVFGQRLAEYRIAAQKKTIENAVAGLPDLHYDGKQQVWK
jgi:hypothetical protein